MIRQAYDLEVDALYIELAEGRFTRTVEIDSGTLVDVGEDGRVLGIEVIGPYRRWPLEEILARFTIAAGDAAELLAYFPRRQPEGQPQHQRARGRVSISA
jgi:uncharacterized protein YuzE